MTYKEFEEFFKASVTDECEQQDIFKYFLLYCAAIQKRNEQHS